MQNILVNNVVNVDIYIKIIEKHKKSLDVFTVDMKKMQI